MLERCPKCRGLRPVGTFHCEVPDWFWTLKERNKPVESKARLAWLRAQRAGRIRPSPRNLEQVNEFYANCPDGYKVVHIVPLKEGGWHEVDNLEYINGD